MSNASIDTKRILNKYGFKFSKSLGQNFLLDDNVLDAIVTGAEINEEDLIIEIGPGIGTLTKLMLQKAKAVYSIELDSKLIPILEEELKEFNNFKLIYEDALKVDYNQLIDKENSVKIVANLPYYITTPIISMLITGGYNFKSLTLMIQKEVGERIVAKEGTKEYGALSLLVQYYCDVHIVHNVSAACFMPQPKVDSIVIRMDKLSRAKVEVKNEDLFFKVIRNAFNMRRKTLWNALKVMSLPQKDMENAFESAAIDPSRRGETLSIFEFGKLSDCIYDIIK